MDTWKETKARDIEWLDMTYRDWKHKKYREEHLGSERTKVSSINRDDTKQSKVSNDTSELSRNSDDSSKSKEEEWEDKNSQGREQDINSIETQSENEERDQEMSVRTYYY